jgi:hypothetical protein
MPETLFLYLSQSKTKTNKKKTNKKKTNKIAGIRNKEYCYSVRYDLKL